MPAVHMATRPNASTTPLPKMTCVQSARPRRSGPCARRPASCVAESTAKVGTTITVARFGTLLMTFIAQATGTERSED